MENQIQTNKTRIEELESQLLGLENSKKDLEQLFEKKENELIQKTNQYHQTKVFL